MSNNNKATEPEYTSVLAFVEDCVDDERDSFTWEDLLALNASLQRPVRLLRRELEGWGLVLAERQPERSVRGVMTSSHDRWFGPGACRTHGGSGWEQISGFAGRGD